MLPFLLKKRAVSGVIVKRREPDQPEESQDLHSYGLEACAQDLIDAVKMEDRKAVADALKAAFEICDSMPHVEGEHIESEEKDEE